MECLSYWDVPKDLVWGCELIDFERFLYIPKRKRFHRISQTMRVPSCSGPKRGSKIKSWESSLDSNIPSPAHHKCPFQNLHDLALLTLSCTRTEEQSFNCSKTQIQTAISTLHVHLLSWPENQSFIFFALHFQPFKGMHTKYPYHIWAGNHVLQYVHVGNWTVVYFIGRWIWNLCDFEIFKKAKTRVCWWW